MATTPAPIAPSTVSTVLLPAAPGKATVLVGALLDTCDPLCVVCVAALVVVGVVSELLVPVDVVVSSSSVSLDEDEALEEVLDRVLVDDLVLVESSVSVSKEKEEVNPPPPREALDTIS